MGDRLNIQLIYTSFEDEVQSLHIYSHWGGHRILSRGLSDAIQAGRGRWDDQSYLGRIILSQLVGEDWNQNLSWGLSPDYVDSEYPDLKVYLKQNIVVYAGIPYSFDEIAEDVAWSDRAYGRAYRNFEKTYVDTETEDCEYQRYKAWIKETRRTTIDTSLITEKGANIDE